MTTVFDHLEAYACEIVRGASVDPDGNKMSFQIVETAGGPYCGTTTFSTLGLGKFPLPNGSCCDKARLIRHELVMVVPSDAVPPNIIAILYLVGMETISRNAALLRGEMLGPRGVLFDGYEPKALYASNPVCFPDGFGSVFEEGLGDIAMAWLIPMLDSEVSYLQAHGWPALEDKWVADDPDLVDYRRKA
ncbi:suppressor of fused domain protein [Xanthomonas sp. NCPPB 2632]|uniref:suppressor of fused domain protein n=1 Tax=Xanthomonas sp. NCPPB 2632 TaxID=3240912 RepID=UPI00351113CB